MSVDFESAARLSALKRGIEAKTGETYPDLTGGVNALIAGFGQGGGGSAPIESVPAKDVNFYDYEGTRVAAYTLQEARELTALPTPPSHDGLVFDGWNWMLSEINALTFPMEVGAQYYTDDDALRFYIYIEDMPHSEVGFGLGGYSGARYTIDWGDGTVETGVSVGDKTHSYVSTGDYVVRVFEETTNRTMNISSATINFMIALRAIELGKPIKNINTMLAYAYGVRYITVHSEMTTFQPPNVKCYIMPRGCTEAYGRENFLGEIVCIAPTQTKFGTYGFMNNRDVHRITFPEGVTTIASRTFRYCNGLLKIVIPSTVTKISTQCINSISLSCIVSLPTTPPTLEAATSIESIPTDCVIYVPDASVDAYKGATNWSTYADRILPLSEYPYSDIIV